MDNLPEVEWSIQGCRLVEIDIVYIYIYNIYKLSDQKTSFVLCAADQSIHDRITSHIIWFSLSNNTSVFELVWLPLSKTKTRLSTMAEQKLFRLENFRMYCLSIQVCLGIMYHLQNLRFRVLATVHKLFRIPIDTCDISQTTDVYCMETKQKNDSFN